ncbi:DNA methyltransferase [Sphingomonas sp.]|uniref:DNA methyltransferase n=1 Tax=Sphingomonas sp. TaxID=28214 RepID=UPI003B000F70
MNKLWYGDNLTIMQGMKKHSVDLIYLDPPFNSKQNYNLLYTTMTGKPVPEQVEAFCDTWQMDAQKEAIAKSMPVLMREYGVDDFYVDFWKLWMNALRKTQPQLLAYLIFMVQRMLHMKSILRPTGSIYLHCDPTASHYIKVMMDGIFGHDNFQNEIVWKRTFAHGGASRWGDIHDTILFYSASKHYKWNRVEQAYDQSYLDSKYRYKDERGTYRLVVLTGPGITKGASGQEWRGYNPTTAGRHWAVPKRAIAALKEDGISIPKDLHDQLELLYQHGFIRFPQKKGGAVGVPEFKLHLSGGQPIQDMILDVPPINSQAKERMGYPTQKPIALLDRIVQASSDPGDVIFDPFCGCGTTIYSAVKNGRKWIGCDIAILSVKLVREVLTETYRQVEGVHYAVDGIPTSVDGAQELFNKDPSTFQNWFVERVGGFPMAKKSADRGIDGRIYFETRTGLREMMIQVKGGKHVRPTDVRDLRGVLEREDGADLAGFLSITPPTKAMMSEAAEAGTFEYGGVRYPRIQFLTTEDVLVHKREFHMPTRINTKLTTGQGSLAL